MATDSTVEAQKRTNLNQQIYIRSLFGISMSDTEATLKRLVRLCPEIVLEKREIELIIDGKINQVISEHRNEDKRLEDTEELRLDEDIQPDQSLPDPDDDRIEEQPEHPLNCSDGKCEDPNHEDNTISESYTD